MESRKHAVVVVDMLNDFITGELACERAARIIPSLERLLEAARSHGIPVIYSGDAHLPSDPEIGVWGEHAMQGTEGAEVIPELRPRETDYLLPKRTYSAFHETGLDPLLRNLGVESVVITGLHTNICDRHTAADAFFRGYGVIVPTDGVDAFTQEDHEAGLEYLEEVYGAELVETVELIEGWREGRGVDAGVPRREEAAAAAVPTG